ncbi:MAG: HAMP domain-containing histidine kinase, partial [Candidatus Aenigmarchaeota archaeon]|nr:HAMP domain-containing histidine kinase [Candidatus Aenigmarchaeota archaeon]
GNAFNKMASDLRESQEKIRKQNEELEQKVEERTYDIQEGKRAIINMMDDTEKLNTELIAAQEKLRQNLNALKETDVKKNQFISIAAHELKTPLTSIHGFSQLLQNRDIAKNQKKREKYLKIMDHETLRLSKIVNDMLDLSRLDLNAVTFDISKVDMNKIIEDIRTEMNIQAKAKGLEIEYSLERSLPKIITDKERLTQILMNLINNAVKYTPKGKITVKVSMEGKDMHFIVKDTGLGIAKNNQDKIFGRFYQVDSSYTRSAGGVGLGLSLCKEFVEVLGGKLWCESAPGKGSEFHFTLPLKFKQAVRKIKK